MENLSDINQLANYVLIAGSVPAIAFLLIFGIGSPWYSSGLGRVIFLLAFSIVTFYGVALAAVLFDEYPGRAWVRLIAFSLLAVALTLLSIIVVIERRAPAAPLSRKESNHDLTV